MYNGRMDHSNIFSAVRFVGIFCLFLVFIGRMEEPEIGDV